MKEVAYPVGYSVMPIYKENKVSSKGTVVKERNLVAYMPSKCYVVNSNDSEKCEVVFPYETGKTVAESYFMSNYPKYNKEGKCTNSHKTTFLASDYETAKEEAARLNEEILTKTVYSKASSNRLFKSAERHANLVSAYMLGADFIEDRTKNMKVTVNNLETTKKATNNKVMILK